MLISDTLTFERLKDDRHSGPRPTRQGLHPGVLILRAQMTRAGVHDGMAGAASAPSTERKLATAYSSGCPPEATATWERSRVTGPRLVVQTSWTNFKGSRQEGEERKKTSPHKKTEQDLTCRAAYKDSLSFRFHV